MEQGRGDVALVLLEHGAKCCTAALDGSTPLLVAAYNGHAECVAAILEGGAAVDSADRHKRTPLHAACHKGRVEVARLLLDGGADATRGDAGGSLALPTLELGRWTERTTNSAWRRSSFRTCKWIDVCGGATGRFPDAH